MMELTNGDERHLFLAQFFLAASAPLLFSRVLFLSQIGSALGPMTQVRHIINRTRSTVARAQGHYNSVYKAVPG